MIITTRAVRILAAILLLLLAAWAATQIVTIGLARQMLASIAAPIAYQLRPGSARGAARAAEAALAGGDQELALQLARTAVVNSPIDAVNLRVLGQALNAQEAGTGDAVMLLAAMRGWRDVPAQIFVIERALRTRQIEIAFQRAEGLARQARDNEVTFTILRLIAADPAGQSMLVRSLATEPFWRTQFFYSAIPGAPRQQMMTMARVLRELAKTSNLPDPKEARPTIDALFESGNVSDAWLLYRDLVPQGGGTHPVDPGFERTDIDYQAGAGSTVFDWRVHPVHGSSAAVEKDDEGDNRVLFARTESNGVAAPVASQVLILAPGRYELSFRMRSQDASAPEVLHFQVSCVGVSAPLARPATPPLDGSDWMRRSYVFVVPGSGCRSQELQLQASPNPESGACEAVFDDLRLKRL